MIKKYIASLVFLFSSLSVFLFFFLKKIPEYAIFLAEAPFGLPSVVKYSIVINYFIEENLMIILIISVFIFIVDVILVALKDNIKTIKRFLIINVILSILFLISVIVSYLSIEPFMMDTTKNLIKDRKLNEYLDNRRIANGEIDDWKTYKDDKYGFEVKYPSKWYVTDRGSGSLGKALSIIYITDINLEPIVNEPKFIGIGIQMLDFSVAVYKKDGSYQGGSLYDETKYPVKETVIDGKKALKQISFYEQEPRVITWVEVKNNDYVYVFEGASVTGDRTFDQIISTFKFIDQ